jgi:hypothetical protein
LATPVGRGTGRHARNTRDRAWMDCSRQVTTNLRGAAAAPSGRITRAPCPRPGRLPRAGLPTAGRTLRISCEAVPASILALDAREE